MVKLLKISENPNINVFVSGCEISKSEQVWISSLPFRKAGDCNDECSKLEIGHFQSFLIKYNPEYVYLGSKVRKNIRQGLANVAALYNVKFVEPKFSEGVITYEEISFIKEETLA